MKKNAAFFLIIAGFFLFGRVLWAQNFKGKIPAREFEIMPPQNAFTAGEKLVYTTEWLGVPVGKVFLNIEGMKEIRGRPCYHISALAVPNSFLKKFIDLEYSVQSYVDKETLVPLRFEKFRRFNTDTNTLVIEFDRQLNEANLTSEGSTKTKQISPLRNDVINSYVPSRIISSDTQDLLSAIYYFRLIPLKGNNSYVTHIFYEWNNWIVNFLVKEPFLKEVRKKKPMVVFEVIPASKLNDLIFGKRSFAILFTADARRLPIELRFKTGIGSIQCKLQNIVEADE